MEEQGEKGREGNGKKKGKRGSLVVEGFISNSEGRAMMEWHDRGVGEGKRGQ